MFFTLKCQNWKYIWNSKSVCCVPVRRALLNGGLLFWWIQTKRGCWVAYRICKSELRCLFCKKMLQRNQWFFCFLLHKASPFSVSYQYLLREELVKIRNSSMVHWSLMNWYYSKGHAETEKMRILLVLEKRCRPGVEVVAPNMLVL